MTILTFRHIQCLHLMYAEVAWVLVSSRTQVQPQVILDSDYLQTIFPFLMTMLPILLFRQPIFTSKTYNHAVTYNHAGAGGNLQNIMTRTVASKYEVEVKKLVIPIFYFLRLLACLNWTPWLYFFLSSFLSSSNTFSMQLKYRSTFKRDKDWYYFHRDTLKQAVLRGSGDRIQLKFFPNWS